MSRRVSSIDAVAAALEQEPPDLGQHSSPQGLVTLMFSDIESSTEMMERIGERRCFELLRRHNEIVAEAVAAHDGRIVKSQGDGFMIAFPSSHAALSCAIDMQRALGDLPLADGERVRVRIGLHAGTVIADADDFFGRNVVLAARIADHARGGEILVSAALKRFTETDRSFAFESYGEIQLKGLLDTHTVYSVNWLDDGGP